MGLLGKLTGSDAAKKQAKDARKQAALREGAALGELTPEAIQKLMQVFFSKYMQMLAPQMMSAQQKVGANLSGAGLGRSGFGKQLKAGIPGQFSQMALGQSIGPAMSTAENRAGIRMDKPIITNPARNGITDLVDLVAQYYTAGGMSTGSTRQQPRIF
jgi:hypothetical protein